MNLGGKGGPGRGKIAFGKISLASSSVPSEESKKEEDAAVAAAAEGGFGTFGSLNQPPQQQSPEEAEMQRVMGFTGFGIEKGNNPAAQPKAAKTFDVKEMVEAIKKSQRQRKLEDGEGTDSVIHLLQPEDEKEKEGAKGKSQSKPEKVPAAAPPPPEEKEEEDDDDVIGPMPPAAPKVDQTKGGGKGRAGSDSSDDSDSDESEDEKEEEVEAEDVDSDVEAQKSFPLEHQLNIEHGMRPVTALTVDPTATRFATGSLDYEVQFWDFTGLRNRHPFRTTKPCENHPIKHVSFSSNGETLLVISGSAQAKVLNRDGSELLECVKGDQYIVDMARTKGHVSALTGGMFNPKNKSEFITSSDDSTVRLWEVENSRTHKNLVKLKNAGGLKNRVTACTYSRDGNCFLGAGFDGTICMWDTRRALVLPTATMKNAHQKGSDIFHVGYSNSGLQMASRGEDGVVNIYDSRNWKSPIFKSQAGEYPAKYFTTDLCFSPDDRHILLPCLPPGTTGRTKDENIKHSTIKFFSNKTLQVVKEHTFPNQIVIRSAWHHRINQILISFASGNVGILYDTEKSQRGALLAHGKGPKKQKAMGVVEDMYGKVVITPNSLPLYKTERSKNPKREEMKLRADPVKSRRPDLPITAGSGGRVAASGSTLSSYVIRNLGLSKSVKDDMDPREAILRYAKDAEENPIWVTPAYQRTQPKPIFQADKEEEPPDPKKPKLL